MPYVWMLQSWGLEVLMEDLRVSGSVPMPRLCLDPEEQPFFAEFSVAVLATVGSLNEYCVLVLF